MQCKNKSKRQSSVNIVGNNALLPSDVIKYRSKVSYHLSYRFSLDESLGSRDESLVSRDETLVSREPLKRIFWNKLQAVSLREND